MRGEPEKMRDSHLDHHTHGTEAHQHIEADPTLLSSQRGIYALKWSFVGLIVTAVFQSAVVLLSASVALLADTIHNFIDAFTAIPLWIALILSRRAPTKRFTYGYGRAEDFAGLMVILFMSISVLVVGYESLSRLISPRSVDHLWLVAVASFIGFFGNELVARLRINIGKKIGSAALVADGKHARTDGLTSLAVLIGVIGIALGFPIIDSLVGLFIAALIAQITWHEGRFLLIRVIDGVDPAVTGEIERVASTMPSVLAITEVRARWLGHKLHAEVNLSVQPDMPVGRGHEVATEVRHELLHTLRFLSQVTVHVDPADASGESYHRIMGHAHGDFPIHSHY